jgi:hypothetical protein
MIECVWYGYVYFNFSLIIDVTCINLFYSEFQKTTTNNEITRTKQYKSTCITLEEMNTCKRRSVGKMNITNCCCSWNLCNGEALEDSVFSTVGSDGSTTVSDVSTVSNGVKKVQNHPFLFIIMGALALLACL